MAMACALLAGGMLTSCEDEVTDIDVPDMAPGEWYLENVELKDAAVLSETATDKSIDMTIAASGLGVSANGDGMVLGSAKQLIIRSNSNWKIVPKLAEGETDDFVMMIPRDGNGEMRVRLALYPNLELTPRSVDYALYVNGVEQENIFIHIDQAAAEAYLNVGAPNLSASGGLTKVGVAANVDWKVEIDPVDWIEIDSIGETAFRLNAKPNTGLETRSVNLRVSAPLFPDLDKEFTVSQLPEGIYLLDNFDWLEAFLKGKADEKGRAFDQPNLYANAKSQQHILGSNKKGNAFLPQTNGWDVLGYGWLYTASCSCYVGWHLATANHTGNGFLKIGRTSFFGDVTTPPFEAIEGTKDIKIRFKAVAQTSTKNVKDGNILCVGILRGSGEIKDANANITVGNFMDNTGTVGPMIPVNVMKFEVENLPEYNKSTAADVDIRDFKTYEVVITGADATTRITFIGGTSIGSDIIGGAESKVANRIFIDEVSVTDVDREF